MSETQNIIAPGYIDIHSHILPDVDDGARTVEESVALLRLAAEQGISAVVATPHYSRRHELENPEVLLAEVQSEIQKTNPDFKLFLGQELFFHEDLAERVRAGKGLTLAGSRYALVEFDPGVGWTTLHRGLRSLTNAGYTPVLAHMERYECLREKGRIDELIGGKVKLQMNYDSLSGSFFNSEVRWCRKQVTEGVISLLGTDMHRTDFRPPQIQDAIRWLRKSLSETEFKRLTRSNAKHIINNETF